jgi:hypothetical protein
MKRMNRAEVKQLNQITVKMRDLCAEVEAARGQGKTEDESLRERALGLCEVLENDYQLYRPVFKPEVPEATVKMFFTLSELFCDYPDPIQWGFVARNQPKEQNNLKPEDAKHLKELSSKMRELCTELRNARRQGKRTQRLDTAARYLMGELETHYGVPAFLSGVPAATQKTFFTLYKLVFEG